jgi:NADP-dependent 3-hydroxy acid dehydrogenase YdfG
MPAAVAVITGGASGFCLALGERCAATGMDVTLLERRIWPERRAP